MSGRAVPFRSGRQLDRFDGLRLLLLLLLRLRWVLPLLPVASLKNPANGS